MWTISAIKYELNWQKIYERWSLWVDEEYRKSWEKNLWKINYSHRLIEQITKTLQNKPYFCVTKVSAVQKYAIANWHNKIEDKTWKDEFFGLIEWEDGEFPLKDGEFVYASEKMKWILSQKSQKMSFWKFWSWNI